MDYSTPGFPILHNLLEFAQTQVHLISDAIQWSHPQSSLFPPALDPSQHQGFFPMSWLFSSGGQSIRASASVLPMDIRDWFPLGLTGLISLQSKGLSRVFSSAKISKHLPHSAFFMVYITTGKNIALTIWTFVGKMMFLLFNTLSGFVIAFIPRSKHFLISWLQSPSAVGSVEPKKINLSCLHCFPIYLPWSDGIKCHDLHFLNVEL